MKKLFLIALTTLSTSTSLFAQDKISESSEGKEYKSIKIMPGSDYSSYSDRDLRRRIWELERVVEQMQRMMQRMEPCIEDHNEIQRDHFQIERRVKKLEGSTGGRGSETTVESPREEKLWLCKLTGREEIFTASHKQKAFASSAVMEQCKAKYKNAPFSMNHYCPDKIECTQ